MAATVSYFSIRNEVKKAREEGQQRTLNQIKTESSGIKSFIDQRLNVVDAKFENVQNRINQGAEDIKDMKTDFKQMTIDFKTVADKVSKNTFILENMMPEFKTLKQDFYNFKSAVDRNIVSKDKSAV